MCQRHHGGGRRRQPGDCSRAAIWSLLAFHSTVAAKMSHSRHVPYASKVRPCACAEASGHRVRCTRTDSPLLEYAMVCIYVYRYTGARGNAALFRDSREGRRRYKEDFINPRHPAVKKGRHATRRHVRRTPRTDAGALAALMAHLKPLYNHKVVQPVRNTDNTNATGTTTGTAWHHRC